MYGRMERKRLGIIELDVSHGDDIQISSNPEANRVTLKMVQWLINRRTDDMFGERCVAFTDLIYDRSLYCIGGEL